MQTNGKGASLWKDWYLEHHSRFNCLVTKRLASASSTPEPHKLKASSSKSQSLQQEFNAGSSKILPTVKRPQFGLSSASTAKSASPQPSSRASSTRPSTRSRKSKPETLSRQASTSSHGKPGPKPRKTMNSITAPTPVYNNSVGFIHSELVVPRTFSNLTLF